MAFQKSSRGNVPQGRTCTVRDAPSRPWTAERAPGLEWRSTRCRLRDRKRGSAPGLGRSCLPRSRKRQGRGGVRGYGRVLGGPLGFCEDRFELGKSLLDLLRRQDKRRQQAQDVVVRAVDQQTLLQGFR